jgi:TatD DNase family protein
MELAEKHRQWLQELRNLGDSQERMSYLVRRARQSSPFPAAFRTEAHRIPGCLSKLWLAAELLEGKCQFQTDSDSAIVKGVASLLCEFFSGATPAEILAYEGDALAESGIQAHLSPNRRNGLGKLRERIRDFAQQSQSAPKSSPAQTSSLPKLYDAHNHLQDPRLNLNVEGLMQAAAAAGIERMVVNGSCEEDWPHVQDLATRFPGILPSFGYHPWYITERTPAWKESLLKFLELPGAGIGEVGLDRWIPDPNMEDQEEVFVWQLRLAAERNLPLSIHCLKAWGQLEACLRREARPARGFLLHSFGGPPEMIPSFAKQGAYFSFPGYYLHERKAKQRETFRQVPLDRLLVETDAPDQLPPPERCPFPLVAPDTSKPINHPANLAAIYQGLAEFLGIPLEALAHQVGSNFHRLFGTT